MTLTWALQWAINSFLLVACMVLWLERRRGLGAFAPEKLTAYLNVLEARATSLETESLRHREKVGLQLKSLHQICEQARSILERGHAQLRSLCPTSEEGELRLVAETKTVEKLPSPESIPTLQELEKTQDRLTSEIGLDLKTILKDQLA